MKLIDKSKFILDDGEIRNCESNINKMNYIEYLMFNLPDFDREWFDDAFNEPFKEMVYPLGILLLNIIVMLTFPISFPLLVWIKYNRKKREKKV